MKFQRYGLVIVVVFSLMVYLLFPRTKTAVEVKAPPPIEKSPMRTFQQSVSERLTHQDPRATTSATHSCTSMEEDLANFHMEELKVHWERLRAEFTGPCRQELTESLPLSLQAMIANCGETLESCQQLLVFLRARAIERLMDKNLPLDRWSESELMNSVLWRFMAQPTPSRETLADNLDMIEELLARHPDSYAAQKALFVHLMMQEMFYQDMSGKERLQESWEALMATGKEPSLQYYPLIRPMMRGDEAGFARAVNDWQAQHPTDAMGPYLAARVPWKSQDRGATIALLEKARALDPQNHDIQTALETARNASFSAPLGKFEVGFGFDGI